ADLIGIQNWYVVAGTGVILMSVLAFFVPAIMRIEQDAAAHKAPPVVGVGERESVEETPVPVVPAVAVGD
ncbi:MAG TPA: hypothetical protein PLD47_00295, partial [Aggregatilineales bacterium]|nr:hypothetical protein [Aggregatilineales bacterium]